MQGGHGFKLSNPLNEISLQRFLGHPETVFVKTPQYLCSNVPFCLLVTLSCALSRTSFGTLRAYFSSRFFLLPYFDWHFRLFPHFSLSNLTISRSNPHSLLSSPFSKVNETGMSQSWVPQAPWFPIILYIPHFYIGGNPSFFDTMNAV